MRSMPILLLTLALASAAPVFAGSGGGKNQPAANESKAASAAAPKDAAKRAAPAMPDRAAIASELTELQQMIQQQAKELEVQRKQIESLQRELAAGAVPAASPVPSAARSRVAGAGIAPAASAAINLPAASSTPAVRESSSSTEPVAKEAPNSALGRMASQLSSLDGGKVRIGATFYGFWAVFPQTGFGPQTLDNTDIYPGPGNNGYNEFNINRTYISIFYTPTPALTFRVTPNVFRQVGGASAEKLSATSATGASVNGNLSFRLKYAYVDWNNPFAHSEAFGKDKLTFGQQQQPLTDWEEGLYNYRFVNLTPWNYLSLSSTYTGVKLHGPIMFHGKQYLDYGIGVFNNSSFHAYEVGEKKQVMARLSYYPFGAVSKYQGLGITGFVDYGYKDAAPDLNVNVPETRVAALVHYQSKTNDYGIAGEYDWGRNAFSEGNLFSGSGPADYFGVATTRYAGFSALTGAILSGGHTHQQGFDFFGHARIAQTRFYLFGMFEQFDPNTNISNDPIAFRTIVGGISYNYDKYWRFALDSKNIIYYHNQGTFPASEIRTFSPSLAAQYPGGIPDAVPNDTNEVSFNILFNF